MGKGKEIHKRKIRKRGEPEAGNVHHGMGRGKERDSKRKIRGSQRKDSFVISEPLDKLRTS